MSPPTSYWPVAISVLNSNPSSILTNLRTLWSHIPQRRRVQLVFLLLLMLVASLVEMVTIGAVLPFLAVLVDPGLVFKHATAQPFIRLLDFQQPEDLLFPLTLLFSAAALLAGAIRLLLIWATLRFSIVTGADLSADVFRRTLYQPYAVHVARNSNQVVVGIVTKINVVIGSVISPCLTLLSSGMMLVIILTTLIVINPFITVISLAGVGFIYGVIIWRTRESLKQNSQCIAAEATNVQKALQEGLGGIRDVLIGGSQEAYCKIYRDADLPMRQAYGNTQFLGQAPRFGMEALGMFLIALTAYSMAQSGEISRTIPVLGTLAIGVQRLLPVLQGIYSAWTNMKGAHASFEDALALLDQPLPADAMTPPPEPLPFKEHIRLNNLSFRYVQSGPWVINKLNLNIDKGNCVGFIGATGSGKSTLLDIVMGLLEPTDGTLEVDGIPVTSQNRRAWMARIAHVPQSIFLTDATITENIAFGCPKDEIDHARVQSAAKQAAISEAIESWSEQYDTLVGERGVRLSGGQRQRIGIARALYKQADVLIFDEATSALDNDTEKSVMEAIENLSKDLTVLIIAHRLTTLRNCSEIVELAGGRVRRTGSYQEIVGQVT